MLIYKIDKGSIPSENFTTSHNYYVIDEKTIEELAYILEAMDLDVCQKFIDTFIQKVMECIYEHE